MISVLMTAYNAEPFIEEAIGSILKQTYKHWELLIADDCSTDETKKVIAKFTDPRIRIYHNSKNLHYLRTRNKLVEKATGDFITLLDADDYCLPTRLERQLDAFNTEPHLGMCGSLVSYVDTEGSQLAIVDNKPKDYGSILEKIKVENVFTGSTIMVRMEVWRSVGGYRDFFNSLGYEDYDLTSRIVEKYPAINLAEYLYIYRQYPDSTSKKNLLYNPFKLHGVKLVQLFIKERQEFGRDSLDLGDYSGIINYVMKLNKPYVDDPSTIYRHFMWTNLNRDLPFKAFQYCIKALLVRPISWLNWKTLLLFFLIKLNLIKG